MAGNQSAWPVYITVGNLPKSIRCIPQSNALLLLALLSHFPKGYKALDNRENFHMALELAFESLQKVYQIGTRMDCADGYVRHCFPRLAAWMADTPEQSLFTGVIGGYCPVCTASKDQLDEQRKRWPERRPVVRAGLDRDTLLENNLHESQPFVERLFLGCSSHRLCCPRHPSSVTLGFIKASYC